MLINAIFILIIAAYLKAYKIQVKESIFTELNWICQKRINLFL